MQQRIRRIAVNEVIANGVIEPLCIVEIEEGTVKAYYRFTEEQPRTEWLGGLVEVRMDKNGSLRAYKNGSLIK